jgi:hypothetical protein
MLSWVWSRITNADPNQGIGWLIDRTRQRGVVDPEQYLSDLDPNFPSTLDPDPDSAWLVKCIGSSCGSDYFSKVRVRFWIRIRLCNLELRIRILQKGSDPCGYRPGSATWAPRLRSCGS